MAVDRQSSLVYVIGGNVGSRALKDRMAGMVSEKPTGQPFDVQLHVISM